MLSRSLRDRLKRLEARIKPQGRTFVFCSFEEPGLPPFADRLAAFKAENGVGPQDTLHTVIVKFE
jgi:hypothetical protein